MSELTQPPCSYCGSPTEPVRQKKLESTKYFYCSDPCTKKHGILLTYEPRYEVLDQHTKSYVKSNLKTAIDMLYTANCLSTQDCLLLFTNSVNSYKLNGEVKKDYELLLSNKGKELLAGIEEVLTKDKIRILK